MQISYTIILVLATVSVMHRGRRSFPIARGKGFITVGMIRSFCLLDLLNLLILLPQRKLITILPWLSSSTRLDVISLMPDLCVSIPLFHSLVILNKICGKSRLQILFSLQTSSHC